MAIAAMFSSLQGLQPASAEIPMLANHCLGDFAVAGKKAFIFSVTANGEFGIQLLTKGGGEVPVLIHLPAICRFPGQSLSATRGRPPPLILMAMKIAAKVH
jgi:hypothetical protein